MLCMQKIVETQLDLVFWKKHFLNKNTYEIKVFKIIMERGAGINMNAVNRLLRFNFAISLSGTDSQRFIFTRDPSLTWFYV